MQCGAGNGATTERGKKKKTDTKLFLVQLDSKKSILLLQKELHIANTISSDKSAYLFGVEFYEKGRKKDHGVLHFNSCSIFPAYWCISYF